MALKCVHKGCGKLFSDPEEPPCVYHPGPPEFHEGQKGWKCCKPRVLTFDEFLAIPPCTTGKHSTVDDTPQPEPKKVEEAPPPPFAPVPRAPGGLAPRLPQAVPSLPATPSPAPEPESEDDDPTLPIAARLTCKRRTCDVESTESTHADRSGESCTFHPGHPIFHEGSKGWSCCKRRVLEFDEFMRIGGCQTKDRHKFVGSGKKSKGGGGGGSGGGPDGAERMLETVRHDFYQTSTTVHASFFLKKIVKDKATAVFSTTGIEVDLPTADNTRYKALIPLYGPIDPDTSTMKILGTKMEVALSKADGRGWPVLRADERQTGEIIQTGQAGRA